MLAKMAVHGHKAMELRRDHGVFGVKAGRESIRDRRGPSRCQRTSKGRTEKNIHEFQRGGVPKEGNKVTVN